MAIECIEVRPGIFFDKVRFRATKKHEAIFGTLMGNKIFYVSEGDEFVIRRSKSEKWEQGDRVTSLEALVTSFNQHKFYSYWT